jgi:hypothetical protein
VFDPFNLSAAQHQVSASRVGGFRLSLQEHFLVTVLLSVLCWHQPLTAVALVTHRVRHTSKAAIPHPAMTCTRPRHGHQNQQVRANPSLSLSLAASQQC